jgi:hypothetical protein
MFLFVFFFCVCVCVPCTSRNCYLIVAMIGVLGEFLAALNKVGLFSVVWVPGDCACVLSLAQVLTIGDAPSHVSCVLLLPPSFAVQA